ncbi:protein kinase/lanthionine synthetase C family protein [Streptomyces sp. So13.3]|uniref:class III lanthionine synthetase LanKC n=1 Tax=Streptomyces TaxID=1883 RepID=UPI001105D6E1|nr:MULTISPECIES: class III lanthionine synthetase LanKC [unclassified Streptomyces]MCZ4102203.1 class III lanthionine synthetase LanKC [Streptomyces sp. H39-C1]QNA70624.1 protein kinase/lanthionine synthetase C family protein [Streptomyces sp. So13.3]
MNEGYAVFCDADRQFYDAPYRLSADGRGRGAMYPPLGRELPDGWQQHRSGDWLAFRPVETNLPFQGWKIHVSACLDNAESILSRVWDYCVPRSIAFKCMPSRYLLHTRNAKYGDRSGSGKFITIYPTDDEQFRTAAEDLNTLLGAEPGPYILTDLRVGAGPVYVRYGSFTERNCYDDQGRSCPAIEDDQGRLVPDRRDPTFHVPQWVTLPKFLRPHLEARAAATVTDLPYRFERALHFSNGGGVYVGTDLRTDARVVLKEARPHAGLAADEADAVTRLERERDALLRLTGLGCTPEVHDWFTVGDHQFLALEFIEGRPLNSFFAHRHPLIEPDPSPESLAEYTAWARRVYGLVEQAVAAIHSRGVVFNDLHLFNIMMSEDESSVVLLDFEAASVDDVNSRQVVANPGFVAPADRRGFTVDTYALACLRLALFLPLTSLFAVDRAKARHLAEIAAEQFPVPRAFLDEAVEEIVRGHSAPHPRSGGAASAEASYLPVALGDWPASRDSMAAAIAASATPDREDRIFPGDIAQFSVPGGGACFAYGAAGVLHALAETGAAPSPVAEEWLLRTTKSPASGTPLGFYNGLAGVAWVLERLGHRERALDLADLITSQNWDGISPDLHGGLAGIGLALDSLAASTGEGALRDHALRCAQLAADTTPQAAGGRPTVRAGLLHGATGTALMYLRLYERSGDGGLLDLAAEALRHDLARCVRAVGGTLQVDEGRRTMPYLGAGSVGIGMVLDDYLPHRYDTRFDQARGEIVQAAQAKFYAQPGLFRGAAGMVLHLARTTTGGPGTHSADLRRQIDSLAWGAVPYQGHLAFAGEQMMRLSMDLSTGTAGCLLALGSALHDTPVHLPFLPPPRRPQSRPSLQRTEAQPRPHQAKGTSS